MFRTNNSRRLIQVWARTLDLISSKRCIRVLLGFATEVLPLGLGVQELLEAATRGVTYGA